MTTFLYYLFAFISAGLILLTTLLVSKKKENKLSLSLKILALVFAGVFVCRYMLGKDAIQNMISLSNTPIDGKFKNFVALILVWFTYSANFLLILYPFFNIKQLKGVVKFFALPVIVLDICLMSLNFTAIIGGGAIKVLSARGILFAVELGLAFGLALFILIKETDWKNLFKKKNKEIKVKVEKEKTKKKLTKKELCEKIKNFFKKSWEKTTKFLKENYITIITVLIVILSTIPSYAIQGLFGFKKMSYSAKDFEIPHRILLYIGLVLPFIVYFALKKQEFTVKKFLLLFICLGTMWTFTLNKKFDIFLDVTAWPLHLCNTAMYIMPLVLIFNMKKFFYFTYFINVVGALFAMLMPNYDASVNIFSTQLVNFYINHYIAFFMPILFVALGMFKKPRFAQFVYSMLGFLAYFVLVLFLNSLFTGLYEVGKVASTTDFFFINSDFIAEKLGTWCENLRDNVAVVNIKGINLTFYPLYQSLFFVVYVGIGLVVWFVYEQGFEIAKSLKDIKARKQVIRLDTLALAEKLNGRSFREPMNPENSNKLILDKFTKRYGNSSVYAVKDACLEVVGGEIFGFLGPNGAGKSTIIKSIVGIQPITEGRIEVCGYDVDTQGVEAKRQIGFVPDHYALYEKLTGREYINYIADLYNVPLKVRNERIDGYVKRFQLETAFDNQMKTYSHGMKQKIAIMAALVHNPKIWILDEPLTGLDPDSIFQVKECMREHKEAGNIVFFSSHIIDVVEKICDRIAIIKKGNILVTKTVAEIEKEGSTLEQFYMNTINGEKK